MNWSNFYKQFQQTHLISTAGYIQRITHCGCFYSVPLSKVGILDANIFLIFVNHLFVLFSILFSLGSDAKQPFLVDLPEKLFKSSQIEVNTMFTITSDVHIWSNNLENNQNISKIQFLARIDLIFPRFIGAPVFNADFASLFC